MSKRPKKITPTQLVIKEYIERGWVVIKVPSGGVIDLIASSGNKLHFIQVINYASINANKYNGLAKNMFIQNAFSNAALPVYAVVDGEDITLSDINLGSSIRLAKKPVIK